MKQANVGAPLEKKRMSLPCIDWVKVVLRRRFCGIDVIIPPKKSYTLDSFLLRQCNQGFY